MPRRDLTEQMAGSPHASLRLLGTDHVDLLFLHGVSNDLLENSDVIALLKRFQAQGKARCKSPSTFWISAWRLRFCLALKPLAQAKSRAVKRASAALSPPLTIQAAALKFVLAHEAIATALVGVRDIAELETCF